MRGTKRRIIRFMLSAIFAAGLLYSCDKGFSGDIDYAEHFVTLTDQGYVRGKNYLYRYSEYNAQKVVNIERQTIRYQDDDQSQFVHVELTPMPTTSYSDDDGGAIETILVWYENGQVQTQVLSLVILKEEGDKFWLWSMESRAGIIAQF